MKNNRPTRNLLICGDNLKVLDDLIKQGIRIDLIYLDPPFFSNKHYEVVWGDEAEVRSFKDRWAGGIHVYVEWMKERIVKMHEVLKDIGSFYLHCDYHASHYLKVMLDDIFGYNNFRNEIVWCYRGGGSSKRDFGKRHDTIFRYTKSDKYKFYPDAIRIPYQAEGIRRTDDAMWGKHKGAEKVYKPHPKGKVPEDWWPINIINANDPERLGYPTQKPEKLLERIIMASSNKEDIILDPFCGCGTAMAVAQKLGRKWIGIDISPTAINLIEKRLAKLGSAKGKDFDSIGMPTTVTELKELEPFEFQNWVINEMQAKQSKKTVADGGLDGHIDRSLYSEEAGIQVKQSENVGRNIVDNFETALERKKYKKGYIVGFSFTKGAHEEAARVKEEKSLYVKLISVEDLLKRKPGLLK